MSIFFEMPKGIMITKIYGNLMENNTNKNNTDTAERKISEIIENEVIKGIEAGYDYGKKQGIEEGEIRGRLKTSRKMLDMNMDFQTIIDVSGFTEEQIKMIKRG